MIFVVELEFTLMFNCLLSDLDGKYLPVARFNVTSRTVTVFRYFH